MFSIPDRGSETLIKFLPAWVIVIMFLVVVSAVFFIRKGNSSANASPVIFLPGETNVEVDRVTLPADTLFDFDKSSIKPEGAVSVREFASKAKARKNVQVVVIGHADPLGSEHHNDALSSARANAVRELLINEGIDSARVVAIGVGARSPLKKREECAGSPRDQKVIDCLAPDRRVELWAKAIETS